MEFELFEQFIEPELLILIPVLYAIGAALKHADFIDDKYIPLMLGFAGIVLAAMWCVSTTQLGTTQEIIACVFAAATQGILCAAGSVFANQVKKQMSGDK